MVLDGTGTDPTTPLSAPLWHFRQLSQDYPSWSPSQLHIYLLLSIFFFLLTVQTQRPSQTQQSLLETHPRPLQTWNTSKQSSKEKEVLRNRAAQDPLPELTLPPIWDEEKPRGQAWCDPSKHQRKASVAWWTQPSSAS